MSGSTAEQEIVAFKNAFGLKSVETDWRKLFNAVPPALKELAKWARMLERLGSDKAAEAKMWSEKLGNEYQDHLNYTLEPNRTEAEKVAKGKEIRDYFMYMVAVRIAEYRRLAKNTPIRSKVGGRDVAVFWTDIPGYEEMMDDAKLRDARLMVEAVAAKIAKGLDLFDAIADGARQDKASAADVTDLAWALKSKAQEKQGPYIKGALTVPNGEKLRKFLDSCGEEVYPRDSSHLTEQQKLPGQSARGMDFYGVGVARNDPTAVDKLLPTGMNTLLFQQVTAANGETLLYMKLETEGAYGTDRGNSKNDPEAPTKRPKRPQDGANARAHALNWVKSRFVKEEDKDLKSTREDLPKVLGPIIDSLIKAVPEQYGKSRLKAAWGNGRLGEFVTTLIKIDHEMELPEIVEPLVKRLDDKFRELFPKDNLGELKTRFGGEVLLTGALT